LKRTTFWFGDRDGRKRESADACAGSDQRYSPPALGREVVGAQDCQPPPHRTAHDCQVPQCSSSGGNAPRPCQQARSLQAGHRRVTATRTQRQTPPLSRNACSLWATTAASRSSRTIRGPCAGVLLRAGPTCVWSQPPASASTSIGDTSVRRSITERHASSMPLPGRVPQPQDVSGVHAQPKFRNLRPLSHARLRGDDRHRA